MGTVSFRRVKRTGRDVDHTAHLAPRLEKSRAILLPFWAFVACSRVSFTFYNVFYTRYLLYGEFMVDIVALELVFLCVILSPTPFCSFPPLLSIHHLSVRFSV